MGMVSTLALIKLELNISAALRTNTKNTPLQLKLNILAELNTEIGYRASRYACSYNRFGELILE
jgi:hypothetical protein